MNKSSIVILVSIIIVIFAFPLLLIVLWSINPIIPAMIMTGIVLFSAILEIKTMPKMSKMHKLSSILLLVGLGIGPIALFDIAFRGIDSKPAPQLAIFVAATFIAASIYLRYRQLEKQKK